MNLGEKGEDPLKEQKLKDFIENVVQELLNGND